MKKAVWGILFVAAALVSCSKTKEGVDETTREIKASASVVDVTTKAPINSDFSSDFGTGIYARNGTWGGGSTVDDEIINENATVSGLTGHSLIFSKTYHYPTNGDVLTFYAYTPYANETTAYRDGASPVVTIQMTGQEDIMWATGTGNKILGNDPIFNYVHKLTQLQFTFKSGVGFPATGYKVMSLVIKEQPATAAMTVETGEIVFAGKQNMIVPLDRSGVLIETAGTDAQSSLMTNFRVMEFLADITVKPLVGSDYTYPDVPITLVAEMGKAHMITFTFNETNVNATSTVADWVNGAGKDVSVQ